MSDRIEVTLYTRASCSLCDKAKASMRAAASLHGLPVVIREVDVDRDPALREMFTDDVPVIYIGGTEAFRHGVTQEAFVAAVRGETPQSNLGEGWRLVGRHHIEKEFRFPNFAAALAFTNRIGAIAEEEGHHPDFELGWGYVRLRIRTHSANAVTEKDFALARKIDELGG